MKHNIRHIVLLSVALALVGALVLSSAVLSLPAAAARRRGDGLPEW